MTRLMMVMTGEVAVVGLTHRLATPHLGAARVDLPGLLNASAGDLLTLLLHLGAWLAAWWLLLGTAHDLWWTIRSVHRSGQRPARRIAPRWVQRAVNQAVGAVLVIGVAAGPAAAATTATVDQPSAVAQVVTPPVPIVGLPTPPDVRPDVVSDSADEGPVTGDEAAPTGDEAAPTGDEEVVATGEESIAGGEHVVASGENLWVIARAHLAEHAEVMPTDREVHAHWVTIIRDNIDRLRSGDPDLIFPGERLRLPELPGQGTS